MPLVLVLLLVTSAGFALFWSGRSGKIREEAPLRFWVLPITSTLFTVLAAVPFLTAGTDVFPFDDSYITLTAARNLLAGRFGLGGGLPLQGITSPLHIILVAGAGIFFGVETAARLIGIAGHIAAAVAAGRLGEFYGRSRNAGLLACVLAALSGSLQLHSLNGLETTLFTALAAWAWLASLKADASLKYLWMTSMLLGAAILTRPEGWFLAAAVYADLARRLGIRSDRRRLGPWAAAVILTLACVAPYLAANLYYSGGLLPSTVDAKSVFFQTGERGPGSSVAATLLGLSKFVLRLVCFLPFFIYGLSDRREDFKKAPAIPIFALLFYVSYAVRFGAGLNMYWLRYQAPLLPFYIVTASAGFFALLRRFAPGARAGAAAGICSLMLLINVAFDVSQSLKHYRSDEETTRTVVAEAARYLRENSPPDALVAAHDIGGPLYFSGRKILDLVGLIDPEVAEIHRRDRSGSLLWDHLAGKRPDYVVMFDAWDRQFLHLHEKDRGGVLGLVWKSARPENPLVQYEIYKCDWSKRP